MRQYKQCHRKKIMYFSQGITDLNQTFRICMWLYAQYIPQILLTQPIWFNRYSCSLNFNIHFKWTRSCSLKIQDHQIKRCTTFHQQFKQFSDECKLPTAQPIQCLKMCYNVHQLQQYVHDQSIAKWYDCLNTNELCGISSSIQSFNSAIMLPICWSVSSIALHAW